jgi:serine/threonine protein kinase/thiol-disulfide isomerase/thioredoxin
MICPKCRREFDAEARVCAYDGTLLVPPVAPGSSAGSIPLGPGSLVGDYQIERLLGEGGMGAVFQAIQPLIGKRVAIKVLKSTRRELIGRFIREARAVNHVRHRNIVDIFTFGQLPDGRHYLVMEYLEGLSLEELLRVRGALPIEEALPILREIAFTLDAVHAHDIVHRDLKPANIFLVEADGAPWQVKLLDFGIAKLLGPDDGLEADLTLLHTRPGVIMGTPQYMGPEYFGSEPIDFRRADIYALGVVAFQMLTGQLPYQAKSFGDLVANIMLVPAPAPSAVAAFVPAWVDAPLLRALHRDPLRRYDRASELVEGLEQAFRQAGAGGETGTDTGDVGARVASYTQPPPTEAFEPGTLAGLDHWEMLRSSQDDDGLSGETWGDHGLEPAVPAERVAVPIEARQMGRAVEEVPARRIDPEPGPPARPGVGLFAGGVVAVGLVLGLWRLAPVRDSSVTPAAREPAGSVVARAPGLSGEREAGAGATARLELAPTAAPEPLRPDVATKPSDAPATATRPTTAANVAVRGSSAPATPTPVRHVSADRGIMTRLGRLEVGRPLPRIAGLTLDGTSALSSDGLLRQPGARGLLVQLWASWCAPCREELAQLARGRASIDQAGIRVLLVNLLEEPEVVEEVVSRLGLEPFPLIRDANGVILEKLGLQTKGDRPATLPVSVLSDAGGAVIAIFTEGSSNYVDRVLEARRAGVGARPAVAVPAVAGGG